MESPMYLDPLFETIAQELECPVCLETCAIPISMCVNGHNFCAHCASKLDMCSVCREPGKPTNRNLFAQKFIISYNIELMNRFAKRKEIEDREYVPGETVTPVKDKNKSNPGNSSSAAGPSQRAGPSNPSGASKPAGRPSAFRISNSPGMSNNTASGGSGAVPRTRQDLPRAAPRDMQYQAFIPPAPPAYHDTSAPAHRNTPARTAPQNTPASAAPHSTPLPANNYTRAPPPLPYTTAPAHRNPQRPAPPVNREWECTNCGWEHDEGNCNAANAICYNCDKRGHYARKCTYDEEYASQSAPQPRAQQTSAADRGGWQAQGSSNDSYYSAYGAYQPCHQVPMTMVPTNYYYQNYN